jgi:adenylate kinase family enzyme
MRNAPKIGGSVFIVGMPGAGKSSLARDLAAAQNWALLSGSSLLRDYIRGSDASSAKEVREAMHRGYAVRSEIVVPLYRTFLAIHAPQSVVIDGNPADTNQLLEETALLAEMGYVTDQVAACVLFCPPSLALQRLHNRRTCAVCSLACTGPICPQCGRQTVSRSDDQDERAIDERVKSFSRQVIHAVRRVFPIRRRLSLRGTHPSAFLLRQIQRRFSFCT